MVTSLVEDIHVTVNCILSVHNLGREIATILLYVMYNGSFVNDIGYGSWRY